MTEVRFSFLVKKYKVTTNSDHKLPVFNNFLNSEFDVALAYQTYVADITYIWVQEGWLYLVVVINLYSRKVFSLIIGSRIKVQLVCDAQTMAICQHRPSAGLIVRTHRCSKNASKSHRKLLTPHRSMSRKDDCWDNALLVEIF